MARISQLLVSDVDPLYGLIHEVCDCPEMEWSANRGPVAGRTWASETKT